MKQKCCEKNLKPKCGSGNLSTDLSRTKEPLEYLPYSNSPRERIRALSQIVSEVCEMPIYLPTAHIQSPSHCQMEMRPRI